ncbi:MAG: hypothetical protein UU48_C0001G0138 [Candidatus Uhrbacteria bacterium GW2011_GWF2_41_16]|uniref:CbiN domain protein n=2 Tax=Candidatus Uhriibacteriota TaxID=1752732 RepID=A0A0G0VD11_9BACT|nr:MAG: hypothetical protein UU31_C0002G0048 [Candidatus Uhrbacteria bacterium GW2011_GWA2_41_10]KKR87844.1 MAG: hypothetical protein UU35_C0001G0125 [Candidatus Uhrbacteria bacterium GW2011_GWC2_41_11]KKR98783.1 MAG: hypothetical protein UU48_C0001G0138 [Candidatus Uhrbacteria bacterium GW2011_GWF2_41_16]
MCSIQRFFLGLSLMGALCGLLVNATPTFACSCVRATSTEQFNDATTVFVGRVKSISEDSSSRSVDFNVSESQKGSVAENVTVTTGLGGGDCGFDFEVGHEYMVYTRGQEQLSTNICVGTSFIASTQDGNREDDAASNPEVSTIELDTEDNSVGSFVIIVLICFCLGALVVYLIGRKKTR